jgi:dihydrofolate reductase
VAGTFALANTDEEQIMGKIAVHEFITLDGVFENPRWTMDFGYDPKMGESIGAIMGTCEGLLLGRHTFEMFAPAWSTRSAEDDPGAPFMNDSPKYVVASTTPSVEWNNSTVLGPYQGEAIRELKDRLGGGLYVSGSGTLVRALLRDGLVDEMHLFVYPVALGAGKRLFDDGSPTTKFSLNGSQAYDNGVLRLEYRPAD